MQRFTLTVRRLGALFSGTCATIGGSMICGAPRTRKPPSGSFSPVPRRPIFSPVSRRARSRARVRSETGDDHHRKAPEPGTGRPGGCTRRTLGRLQGHVPVPGAPGHDAKPVDTTRRPRHSRELLCRLCQRGRAPGTSAGSRDRKAPDAGRSPKRHSQRGKDLGRGGAGARDARRALSVAPRPTTGFERPALPSALPASSEAAHGLQAGAAGGGPRGQQPGRHPADLPRSGDRLVHREGNAWSLGRRGVAGRRLFQLHRSCRGHGDGCQLLGAQGRSLLGIVRHAPVRPLPDPRERHQADPRRRSRWPWSPRRYQGHPAVRDGSADRPCRLFAERDFRLG